MTTTANETDLLGVVLTPRQIWELLDLVNDAEGDADEDVLDAVAAKLRSGLERIQSSHTFFTGIRQRGVIFGLEFNTHPEGAKIVMRELYAKGIWAIFSTLDPRVLQYKPGILLSPELVDEILDRTEIAIGKAYAEWKSMSRQAVTA